MRQSRLCRVFLTVAMITVIAVLALSGCRAQPAPLQDALADYEKVLVQKLAQQVLRRLLPGREPRQQAAAGRERRGGDDDCAVLALYRDKDGGAVEV